MIEKSADFHVAIVGNPNCGKTTLFNLLTGHQQSVGNWAGVTTEKKTGLLPLDSFKINITDLPGIYSLTVADQHSALDEYIACRHLAESKIDLIINIVDATHLKRHLYLTRQLLELRIPCLLVLNMMDMAKHQQVHINHQHLAHLLGCPVIPMVCRKKQGILALKAAILTHIKKKASNSATTSYPAIQWPKPIQDAINHVQTTLLSSPTPPTLKADLTSWTAIRLLEKDSVMATLFSQSDVLTQAQQEVCRLEHLFQEDSDIILADCRYQWIEQILTKCCIQQTSTTSMTQKMDTVVLHPWLGMPIFFLMMYFMFEFSMRLGTLLQPLFDESTAAIFVDGVHHLGSSWHIPALITTILANGIGLGINTVISFTPQISLLFLALSFLEDCGYMARAAFVMDRLMQAVGLPGKSFIPLMIGFGCNVPAIMAARTLDSPRDRIITALMTPFMSCGARLAIFVIFSMAFFPQHAGLVIFLLYIIGILVAFLTALLLKKTILHGNPTPFVLEMPSYHLPTLKGLSLTTWLRLKGFLIRAGKIIIPISVLVGSLNTIQLNGQIDSAGSQRSILATAGRWLTPCFTPMGIHPDNWPATVGLLTGTLAKEVVVGTLNTLYTQTQSSMPSTLSAQSSYHLHQSLKTAWHDTIIGFTQFSTRQQLNPFTATLADHSMNSSAMGKMALAFGSPWAAMSYLLFVLLYMPCISTIAALAREIGVRWAVLSAGWSLYIAYSLATLCYQLNQWSQHPVSASVWVSIILGIPLCLYWVYPLSVATLRRTALRIPSRNQI